MQDLPKTAFKRRIRELVVYLARIHPINRTHGRSSSDSSKNAGNRHSRPVQTISHSYNAYRLPEC